MSNQEKKLPLAELAAELAELRSRPNAPRVVHCHGVFDLLHIGHIRYLQRAKQLGDLLVVTLTPDQHVNKGPHRPAFQEQLRADALAALDCVDYVAINEWATASETIQLLRPDVYAKGTEFRRNKTPELIEEEAAAANVGADVEFIEEFTSSSSYLLNKFLSPFDEATKTYLGQFIEARGLEEVLAWVDRARQLRVLVVGEAIIDEYYSCSAIGRSGKAPILATRYNSHARFAGGAVAVAKHLAGFCQQVDLLTMVGDQDNEHEWLQSQIPDSMAVRFFEKLDSPTIVKRRYRETYFATPLFAINFLSDTPLSESQQENLNQMLAEELEAYDAVIVTDYGHEMLPASSVRLLSERARFLSVNTQANAANTGFHTISKYPSAHFVSLAERELQLECRSQTGDLREQLREVADRLQTNTIVVTLGKRGCLCYDRESGFHEAASLATNVVDRIGAGDAFFAMSSLCAAMGAPVDVLAFLGNVAGAEAVAVVGNSRNLEDLPFRRHVNSLFK